MSELKVLVLMGGPDAEREVSIMSGREVARALRDAGCAVVEQVIDTPNAAELCRMAEGAGSMVVFPVLHGKWGEGGPLQERLEEAGLAYVGSGPKAAALAMDKLATKALLAREGVRTPQAVRVGDDELPDLPLVLKPVDDGSSVDLRICRTEDELQRGLVDLQTRREHLMAEQYIAGREVTVGILLGQALPLIEIVPAVEFYDYEAKYTREDTRYVFDPDLPPAWMDECRRAALLAHQRIGCRDVARVDFLVDERGPWFLEINTMPGFTTHSLVPMAAAKTGSDMPTTCRRLVEAAMERARSKAPALSNGG